MELENKINAVLDLAHIQELRSAKDPSSLTRNSKFKCSKQFKLLKTIKTFRRRIYQWICTTRPTR